MDKEGLGQFQQGNMDVDVHTEHRLTDQKETRTGKLLTAQFLTGHGCYRVYLHKYGHDVGEACAECRNERETAMYVFFTCPRYVDQPNCLERTIGFQITLDYIVNLQSTSFDNWKALCIFARRLEV